jgi:hypothetical protein
LLPSSPPRSALLRFSSIVNNGSGLIEVPDDLFSDVLESSEHDFDDAPTLKKNLEAIVRTAAPDLLDRIRCLTPSESRDLSIRHVSIEPAQLSVHHVTLGPWPPGPPVPLETQERGGRWAMCVVALVLLLIGVGTTACYLHARHSWIPVPIGDPKSAPSPRSKQARSTYCGGRYHRLSGVAPP